MICAETLNNVTNENVYKALLKASEILGKHNKVYVSISGGADSDIMTDIIEQCKAPNNEIHYLFIQTGIEYRATLEHLVDLEKRYGIEIERIRPKTPIPLAVKKYGVPFLSKHVSEMVKRAQKHNFKWEDGTWEELNAKYPNLFQAIKWWSATEKYKFSIRENKYLKEFMLANPPDFPISSWCCNASKKQPLHKIEAMGDLACVGIRNAEGGVRAKIKSCYNPESDVAKFFPVFWLTKADKEYYEQHFGITHSRCYTEYGLKRTGCVGCPFNIHYKEEMKVVEAYEPNAVKACKNVFGRSYEYTERYREFRRKMETQDRIEKTRQMEIDL